MLPKLWRAIGRKYLSYGGNAKLGRPRRPDFRVGERSARYYDKGAIYYSDGTGAHAVLADILSQYASQGGPSRFYWPTADETELRDGSGKLIGKELQLLDGSDPGNWFVFYYGNSLDRAHWVHGGILTKYLEVGEYRSCLGFPTSDQTENSDGTYQNTFEHGRILYNGSNGSEAVTCFSGAPTPQPIVVDESGASGGSGSLSASPNGNYGSAWECTTPNAFSIYAYPPRNCADQGTDYRDNSFLFTGNDNCVSEQRLDSGTTFTWTVTIPVTGRWHVDVYIPYWTSYNLGAVYRVDSDVGAHESQVNQQDKAGQWVRILEPSPLTAGRQYSVTLDGRNLFDHFCHYQAADQVRWTPGTNRLGRPFGIRSLVVRMMRALRMAPRTPGPRMPKRTCRSTATVMAIRTPASLRRTIPRLNL
jgi:hypothetical protein